MSAGFTPKQRPRRGHPWRNSYASVIAGARALVRAGISLNTSVK